MSQNLLRELASREVTAVSWQRIRELQPRHVTRTQPPRMHHATNHGQQYHVLRQDRLMFVILWRSGPTRGQGQADRCLIIPHAQQIVLQPLRQLVAV